MINDIQNDAQNRMAKSVEALRHTLVKVRTGRASTALGEVVPSYKPGVTPTDLAQCLPDYAVSAIREALRAFERRIPGFSMADAVMTGVETRTSSPIRIPRSRTLRAPGHAAPRRSCRTPRPARLDWAG